MEDTQNSVNLSDVEKYFNFLSDYNESEIFCFSWMDAKSTAPIKGQGVRFGKWREIVGELERRWTQTLHVVLNQTDLKGRKRANIQAARVFCVDIDVNSDLPVSSFEGFGAQLIVESSPGKYHLYWKADPNTTLDDWRAIQASLCAILEGDPALTAVNKMIRVPGIKRVCKDGTEFTPQIRVAPTDFSEVERWDLSRFRSVFGEEFLSVGKDLLKAERERVSTLRSDTRKALKDGNYDELASSVALGKRNETLYEVTKTFVTEQGMNGNGPHIKEGEAYGFAEEFNSKFSSPLSEEEVEKTARSAWEHAAEYLAGKAEKVEAASAEHDNLTSDLFPYDYSVGAFQYSRWGDLSIIERVMQRFPRQIVHVGKILYAFDEASHVWRAQRGTQEVLQAMVTRCTEDVIKDPRFLTELCTGQGGEVSPDKLKRMKEKYQSARLISGCVAHLASGTYERLMASDFDTSPELMLTPDGVLNIATGALEEPVADSRMLQKTLVNWDPSADYSWWEKFLLQVFAKNDNPVATVKFMKQLFGYSLSTSIDAQLIFVHYGSGSNGKSKVLEALEIITGGYATRIECTALSRNKSAIQKEFNRLAPKLEGKRIAIIDDLDTATQWNEGFVKSLTSKKLPMRKLYEEEVDIPNRAKFHLGCNEVPRPEAENFGILRRICIIPYLVEFEPSMEKEKEIRESTTAQASSILRWAVEGYRELKKAGSGLAVTSEMRLTMEEYKSEHFTTEGAVLSMFSVPKVKNEGSWEKLSDLVKDVNARLAGRDVTEISLGRLLKTKLGLSPERVREGGIRERNYFLKLNYRRNTSDNLL